MLSQGGSLEKDKVGNGERVSEYPTRLLFPDLLSLAALGALVPHYSEQMRTLIRCCTEHAVSLMSLQQHDRALHQPYSQLGGGQPRQQPKQELGEGKFCALHTAGKTSLHKLCSQVITVLQQVITSA
ncbi:ovarian cancer G-protein coupled receptor 1 isoform 2-T4 [Theristicus caerulescens]